MIKYFKKVKITNNMNDNRSVYYVFTECQLIIMNIFFAMSHLFQQIFYHLFLQECKLRMNEFV